MANEAPPSSQRSTYTVASSLRYPSVNPIACEPGSGVWDEGGGV